jgi:predicted outer membrane repeat protein
LFYNSSAASGGAIGCRNFGFDLNRNYGLSIIKNTIFENNQAIEFGGAIFSMNCDFDMENNIFS